jgi:hypothetical protein
VVPCDVTAAPEGATTYFRRVLASAIALRRLARVAALIELE